MSGGRNACRCSHTGAVHGTIKQLTSSSALWHVLEMLSRLSWFWFGVTMARDKDTSVTLKERSSMLGSSGDICVQISGKHTEEKCEQKSIPSSKWPRMSRQAFDCLCQREQSVQDQRVWQFLSNAIIKKTKWGNILRKNGSSLQQSSETFTINAKAYWSCFGGTRRPNTSLRHFMLAFPLICHHLYISKRMFGS